MEFNSTSYSAENQSDLADLQFKFGQQNLGPVISQFIYRLHTHLHSFSKHNKAKILFVSRAGIRIRKSLEVMCQSSGRDLPSHMDDLWVSRLMIAKGVWRRCRSESIDLIQGEFQHSTLNHLIGSMFSNEGLPTQFDNNDPELNKPGREFRSFINSGSKNALLLAAYLDEQSELFESYLSELTAGHKQICLVDSGWQGTIQRLLSKAYPELDWWGIYFGKYGNAHTDRSNWHKMIGLVFEQDHFDPGKPETSVICHRHLIEDLFEPNGKSIERLLKDASGKIHAPESKKILEEIVTKKTDPIFAGVVDYLSDIPNANSITSIQKAAQSAWLELARIITLPSRKEALVFKEVQRSADFGKKDKVSLLLAAEDRIDGDSPERRIAEALWQPAQAALEYPEEIAKPLQRKISSIGRSDFAGEPVSKVRIKKAELKKPRVAIITRTMDRPMFLKRAIKSVAGQSFDDYIHVVVNDGGDIEKAKETILAENCNHNKVILVDNVINRGMEAASNIAIAAADSDYIVIHDDDDSWEPNFLKESVEFLDSPKNRVYRGVITKTTYVSEEVTPKGIKIHGNAPYQDWVENVHIMEMSIGNFFAPIAFVFSRDVYNTLKGFDERYPVLGDWDFNLRFLLESDIGIVRKPLANYHHRDVGDTSLFGNSVISGRDKHLEYSAIVRNKFARNLLHSDHPAVAMLVGMGLHFGANRDSIQAVNHKLDNITSANIASQPPLQPVKEKIRNGLTEEYWVALNNLTKAIEHDDQSVLKKIHNKSSKKFGLGWKKDDPVNNEVTLTSSRVKDLASLKGQNYPTVTPPPDFDESSYLALYPDVAGGISNGDFRNGYEHYYYFGRFEDRSRPSVG